MNAQERASSEELMKTASMIYRGSADRFDLARARQVAPPDAGLGVHGDALAHATFEDQSPNHDQLARLTPAEVDRLQEAIQQGIYLDDSLLSQCAFLGRDFDASAEFQKP